MITVSSLIMTEWAIWQDLVKPEDNVYCNSCQNIYHKKCIEAWLRYKTDWPTWKAGLDINKMKCNRVYANAVESLEEEKRNVAKNLNAPKQLHKRYECKQHEKESDLWCSDWNVVVWSDCVIEGKHKNCNKEYADETMERYKSCLNTKLDKMFKVNSTVKSNIDSFNFLKYEKSIENTIQNIRQKISKAIDEELKELKSMLNSINNWIKSLPKEHSEMLEFYNETKKFMQSDD